MASFSSELTQGIAAFRSQNYDQAWVLLAAVPSTQDVEYSEALPFLWKICLQRGDTEQALAFMRQSAYRFISADAYHEMAELFFKGQRLEDAAENYLKVIELNPKYTDAFIRLGMIHAHLHDYEKAISFLDRAISLDPKALAARWWLAQVCNSLGDRQRALGQLTVTRQLAPGFMPARMLMTDIHLSLGDNRQALVELCAMADEELKEGGIFLRMARAFHALGDADQTMFALERAFRLQPDMARAGLQAAGLREAREHFRASLELYELLREAPEEYQAAIATGRNRVLQRLPGAQRESLHLIPYQEGEEYDPRRKFLAPSVQAPEIAEGTGALTPQSLTGQLRPPKATRSLELQFMENARSMESWFSAETETASVRPAPSEAPSTQNRVRNLIDHVTGALPDKVEGQLKSLGSGLKKMLWDRGK